MASIQDTAVQSRQSIRTNGAAGAFAPATKVHYAPLKAAQINGTDHYIVELVMLERWFEYYKAAGYIPKDADTIEEAHKLFKQAQKDIGHDFEHHDINTSPVDYYDNDNTEVMVAWNNIGVEEGAWFYSYKEVLEHRKDIREALISGLWLLHKKMHFKKLDDQSTAEWEWYNGYETDDEDENDEWKELCAFYKTEPIKLRWYARSFHKHACTQTPLGDWLRCLWHYRKFNWHQLTAWATYETNDWEPITIYQSRAIAWDNNDGFAQRAYDDMDAQWREAGDLGLADCLVVRRQALMDKAIGYESEGEIVQKPIGYTDEQRLDLEIDFNKMWNFNLLKLQYDYERHNESDREYNYKRRRVCASNAAHRLQGKKQSKDLRRANTTHRRRRALRKRTAKLSCRRRTR